MNLKKKSIDNKNPGIQVGSSFFFFLIVRIVYIIHTLKNEFTNCDKRLYNGLVKTISSICTTRVLLT